MNPYAASGDGHFRQSGPIFGVACIGKLWHKLMLWFVCEVGVFLLLGQFCFEWPLMLARLFAVFNIAMHLYRGRLDQQRINDAREAFDVVEAELAEPTPPPITSGERYRLGQ